MTKKYRDILLESRSGISALIDSKWKETKKAASFQIPVIKQELKKLYAIDNDLRAILRQPYQ